MKKIILIFITFLIIFNFIAVKDISADDSVAETSAMLVRDTQTEDLRVIALSMFFAKYESPLAPYAEYFIKYADEYNIDWRLIPAITGVESTYGKNIPLNSYNAYGWANGNYYFDSWIESIDIVSQTLRNDYINKGAETVSQIARIYAPPSTTWAYKVKYIMNKIDPLPLEYSL